MADTLDEEIKQQGLSVDHNVLESSISFGRFESEMLSWDRWSSFSQNKYLEEVGKCSTPGSVAKKKAYFEAHYKKIAAQKSETLEEDSQMEADDTFRAEYPSSDSSGSNSYETDFKFDAFDLDRNISLHEPPVSCSSQEIRNDVKEEFISSPYTPKSNDSDLFDLIADDYNSVESHNQFEDLAVLLREEKFSMGSPDRSEHVVDLVKVESDSIKLGYRLEEPQLVNLDAGSAQVNDLSEAKVKPLKPQLVNLEAGSAAANDWKEAKLKPAKELQKRTPSSHEKSAVKSKKKPEIITPRSVHASVKGTIKPTSALPAISASRSSTRSGQLFPRKNISFSAETKKSTNTSLNMPPSLRSTSIESTPGTTRRSSIMENMGDKEIVKRAFKSFQKFPSPQSSFIETKPAVIQKRTKNGIKQIASSSSSKTLQSGKERTQKPLMKAQLQRGQIGVKSTALARHTKEAGVSDTSAKAVPLFGLRSDKRAEKRREFLKKLEGKSNEKDVERTRLRSKSMEDKDAEIKKLRRNLNFKAIPMPEFYQEKSIRKSLVNKEDA